MPKERLGDAWHREAAQWSWSTAPGAQWAIIRRGEKGEADIVIEKNADGIYYASIDEAIEDFDRVRDEACAKAVIAASATAL